jgi:hypothetical protein
MELPSMNSINMKKEIEEANYNSILIVSVL